MFELDSDTKEKIAKYVKESDYNSIEKFLDGALNRVIDKRKQEMEYLAKIYGFNES